MSKTQYNDITYEDKWIKFGLYKLMNIWKQCFKKLYVNNFEKLHTKIHLGIIFRKIDILNELCGPKLLTNIIACLCTLLISLKRH